MATRRTRANKRQEIIDAALRLLSTTGLEGFTASALAKAAGVRKANLFHHFETLDDIVLESFEQYALGLEMMRPPAGLSFSEWLRGMAVASFGVEGEGASLTRAYAVFVARALFDERLRQRVLRTVELACDAFADVVAETYPGELERDEIRAMASLIFMAGDGLAIHLNAFPERRSEILASWALFVDRMAPAGKEVAQ